MVCGASSRWCGNIIYGLVDALEPERVRYVGKTTTGGLLRYTEHIRPGGKGKARATWIADLFLAGRYPDMVLLEDVDGDADALSLQELLWIHRLKGLGQADLNGALGVPELEQINDARAEFQPDPHSGASSHDSEPPDPWVAGYRAWRASADQWSQALASAGSRLHGGAL